MKLNAFEDHSHQLLQGDLVLVVGYVVGAVLEGVAWEGGLEVEGAQKFV